MKKKPNFRPIDSDLEDKDIKLDQLTYLDVGKDAGIEPALLLYQDDLNRLSASLGRNIKTAEDLIAATSRLTTCSVQGVSITLEPGLLTRIKSRCIRQEFSSFLAAEIKRQLHAFVGY